MSGEAITYQSQPNIYGHFDTRLISILRPGVWGGREVQGEEREKEKEERKREEVKGRKGGGEGGGEGGREGGKKNLKLKV